MPVTFYPAKHPIERYPFHQLDTSSPPSAQSLLQSVRQSDIKNVKEIIQSSFPECPSSPSPIIDPSIDATTTHPHPHPRTDTSPSYLSRTIPSQNGLFYALSTAHSQHYAISIRPDDVWLAILTQFSFYVNRHSDTLRSRLLAPSASEMNDSTDTNSNANSKSAPTPKKQLNVRVIGNRYTVDFGHIIATQMKNLLLSNLRDAEGMGKWVIPSFSTTTETDEIVASIALLATMKNYFTYKVTMRCGIPRVTLEGEKGDWEELARRVERLSEFDAECEDVREDGDASPGVNVPSGTSPNKKRKHDAVKTETDMERWYSILKPVVDQFVKAFDDPHGEANIDFWETVCHHQARSGTSYCSGWITAFSALDRKGKWNLLDNRKRANETTLFETISGNPGRFISPYKLNSTKVTGAYVEVDLLLDDNGEMLNTILLAGMVGFNVGAATESLQHNEVEMETVKGASELKPVSGWWLYETNDSESKLKKAETV